MASATATPPKKKHSKRKNSPAVTVTIAMFDSSHGRPVYRPLRDGQPVQEFQPLGAADYRPAGGTPLHDATAQFIAHLEKQRRPGTVVIGALADESGSMGGNQQSVVDGINEFVGGMANVEVDPDTDGKVLAVILTDGMENSSTEVTHQQVAQMIQEREADGWTFIYMGANQDAWSVGSGLGTTRRVNFASTAEGTRGALRNASVQASSYLSNHAGYTAMACAAPDISLSENGDEIGEPAQGRSPRRRGGIRSRVDLDSLAARAGVKR